MIKQSGKGWIIVAATIGALSMGAIANGDLISANENWIATAPEQVDIKDNDISYTLKKGDTLWVVSMKINVNVQTLASINNVDLTKGEQYDLPVGLIIKFEKGELTVVKPDGEIQSQGIKVNNSNKIVENKSIGTNVVAETNNNDVNIMGNPNNITKETAPKETAPKETAPKETAPKETAPKETAPKETAPKETAPKETAPKETAPKETAPKETAPKETAPKETAPKETTPKETAPAIELPGVISEEDKEESYDGQTGEEVTEGTRTPVEGSTEEHSEEVTDTETGENKVITTKIDKENVILNPGTVVIYDNTLEKGVVVIEEIGKPGYLVKETTNTLENDVIVKVTGPIIVTEVSAVDRIERHGTKELVGYKKQLTEVVEILHGKEIIEDASKDEGYKEITQIGEDGKRVITYEVEYDVNNIEINRRITNEQVTDPKNTIIVIGTKKAVVETPKVKSTKTITRQQAIPHQVEFIYNDNKDVGYRHTVVEGIDGMYKVTEQQDFLDGKLVKTTVTNKERIKNASVAQVEVGTKESTVEKIEPITGINLDNVREMFGDLVNEERNSKGISSLKYSEYFDDSVNTRAFEVRPNGGTFDHKRPDGTDFRTVDELYTVYNSGENILYFGSFTKLAEEEVAERMFTQWKNSSGHYKNMMTEDYTNEALGIHVQKDNAGTYYYSGAQILTSEKEAIL